VLCGVIVGVIVVYGVTVQCDAYFIIGAHRCGATFDVVAPIIIMQK
jgi:hypothetical protein